MLTRVKERAPAVDLRAVDPGESTWIFDWVETSVSFRTAISSTVDLRFGMSVMQTGADWFGLGFDV